MGSLEFPKTSFNKTLLSLPSYIPYPPIGLLEASFYILFKAIGSLWTFRDPLSRFKPICRPTYSLENTDWPGKEEFYQGAHKKLTSAIKMPIRGLKRDLWKSTIYLFLAEAAFRQWGP